ncbi:SGNH/GDSL hydrolase family protein [Peribacillus sp. SCS-26]|uniref:SGNH/GDSL hydrolase family protein n=1 Tax=Paraperibacillus marinus TaxID=3115295 RepID=UPI0039063353
MGIRRFFITLILLFTVAVVFYGNIHWNNKISSANERKAAAPAAAEKEERAASPLTASIPVKEIRNIFQNAEKQNKDVKIVFLGSQALGSGENSWPELAGRELKEKFTNVSYKTLAYPDFTYKQYHASDKVQELIAEKADIVIFEPFSLNNNGELSTETVFSGIQKTIKTAKEAKKNTLFILQPTHPIPNATIYPDQVDELKSFAKTEGYLYLDHWTNWPDYGTSEIDDYLTEDNSAPSDKGHKIWADSVLSMFMKDPE